MAPQRSGWHVESTPFADWYQRTWGEEPPMRRTIWATTDHAMPGWKAVRGPKPARRFWQLPRRAKRMPLAYNLENKPEDEVIMTMLQEAFATVDSPFLEQVSSLEGAARWYEDDLNQWDHACDLHMSAGNEDWAREFLERCLEEAGRSQNTAAPEIRRRLELRKAKYFEA